LSAPSAHASVLFVRPLGPSPPLSPSGRASDAPRTSSVLLSPRTVPVCRRPPARNAMRWPHVATFTPPARPASRRRSLGVQGHDPAIAQAETGPRSASTGRFPGRDGRITAAHPAAPRARFPATCRSAGSRVCGVQVAKHGGRHPARYRARPSRGRCPRRTGPAAGAGRADAEFPTRRSGPSGTSVRIDVCDDGPGLAASRSAWVPRREVSVRPSVLWSAHRRRAPAGQHHHADQRR